MLVLYDLQMKSVALTPRVIAGCDCVLVATNHSAYDWQTVADNAALVVDARGARRNTKGRRDHVVGA